MKPCFMRGEAAFVLGRAKDDSGSHSVELTNVCYFVCRSNVPKRNNLTQYRENRFQKCLRAQAGFNDRVQVIELLNTSRGLGSLNKCLCFLFMIVSPTDILHWIRMDKSSTDA
jgi:hypothetical protein